ncbi:SDR family NAD(P)-dependent oxidoreductase [Oleiagrimonas sp. C23AA]|uniref:SDR family NAD(P)-dependent oxidoreductase n=1 Tax=Oleiagrimonas sp. C23AA TaxID=2719047 RepID=UPI001420B026|nr:SDR family NAD(P)-dependent oxidoreductase [Oleiagrimonas sp. C23AA]NII10811.1 SDR family NAD(P)-dependent oxidoreductase [Oleiagrimonas sp. C23AA]
MQINGKRIVITGGSSGIGYALARSLLARGAHVLIVGRDADKAAQAARRLSDEGRTVHAVVADVATDAGRAAILAGARHHLGGLDVLVNNAGGVRAGRLETIDADTIRQMIDVNLLAPILLTRQALPMLRESGDAVVLNVASAIALVGMPFYTIYAATKAGLARFSEALRRELKHEGVHVITAYPGGTDTPMMRNNRAGPDLGFSLEPATDVAEAIADGLATEAFEVIRGGPARTEMVALNRTDPGALDARFAGLKAALEEAVSDHSAM